MDGRAQQRPQPRTLHANQRRLAGARLGRADQDAALAFLAEHRALLSREAARYIVEKLPADVQAAALAG